MRRVISGIIFYLLAIVIVSAVLTPVAWWATSAAGWEFPVRRVFNRTLMLSAVLLLWPLVKFLRIESWRRCGVTGSGVSAGRILFWFAAGAGTIAVLYLGQAAASVAVWAPRMSLWQPLTFLLMAVIVSVIEEIMFRGVLFCAWISTSKWRMLTVMVIGSAFFATAHFIKAQNPALPVTWLTGWEIWSQMGGRFLIWQSLVMNWLTLFLTGMTLCAVAWRYRNIWLSAALHAGWVFSLKTAGRLLVTEEKVGSLWFACNALEGLWPALLLAVLCAAVLNKKIRDL